MTDNEQATQADAGAQSQADTPTDDATPADALETISLDEAKKLRSEAASLRKRLKDAETKTQAVEDERRKAEAAKAKEQGKFQELYEAEQKRVSEMEAQITQRDAADLRRKVATKHNLPDELADRLRGDDEAELEADAKTLAKLIPLQPKPGNGPNPAPAGPADFEARVAQEAERMRATRAYRG